MDPVAPRFVLGHVLKREAVDVEGGDPGVEHRSDLCTSEVNALGDAIPRCYPAPALRPQSTEKDIDVLTERGEILGEPECVEGVLAEHPVS